MRMISLFILLAILVAAIAVHNALMGAIDGYEQYGERHDYTRRIDQLYFELYKSDQYERASR